MAFLTEMPIQLVGKTPTPMVVVTDSSSRADVEVGVVHAAGVVDAVVVEVVSVVEIDID